MADLRCNEMPGKREAGMAWANARTGAFRAPDAPLDHPWPREVQPVRTRPSAHARPADLDHGDGAGQMSVRDVVKDSIILLLKSRRAGDGGASVWFGPTLPQGHEGNWVQTMPAGFELEK
jgi:hypothetical protein